MTLSQVLQSLIFASPKPMTVEELHKILRVAGESSEHPDAQALAGLSRAEVEESLAQTREAMEREALPFRMVEGAVGWSMVTHADYAPWVRQLYPEAKPTRLSGPALETLAIIAYRQPLTRADIEAVRGVAVDGVMQVLLDRGLVKISGRAELPGRPLLYSTTTYFLEHFGLKSTEELPNSEELRRLDLPKAEPPEEKPSKKKARKMEGVEGGGTSAGEGEAAGGETDASARSGVQAGAGADSVEQESAGEPAPVSEDLPAAEGVEVASAGGDLAGEAGGGELGS
jgi:segregation and condensation protein B